MKPDNPPERQSIEVLVPVFGAAAELSRCLRALQRYTDLTTDSLRLLVDGPQPPTVEAILAPLETAHDYRSLEVRRAPSRLGYVANVNRGLVGTSGDVVLVNSDTEVTAGWLDKLHRAAGAHKRVASVTPFSNNATLCSLPRFLEENDLPGGYDVDSLGRLVENASSRNYPVLPTGIGFCLYLTRAALDDVGSFDARRFGIGYGEEVEWCLRARERGWVHILDDATFVYHAGQSSFSTSRAGRVRAAHRVLRRRYPSYLPEVAEFIRRDPLAPLRRRVVDCLLPLRGTTRGPERVVHLVHGWPPYAVGGTELYAQWLVERQARWRQVAVLSRLAHPHRELGDAVERLDAGVRVRLLINNFQQRNPLSRNALYDRTLAAQMRRFLAEEDPELVHIHHLAGHAANLARVAAERGIPIVFQLQDWWAPCARVNLFHRSGRLCSGPAIAKCAACRPLTALPGTPLWNLALHRFRRVAMRRALATADIFVAGSQYVVDSYRRWGFLPPSVPVRVVPYGIDRSHLPTARKHEPADRRPLRCGFVGALLPHKGVAVAVAAFAGLDPAKATLEVWGNPLGDPAYVADLKRRADPRTVRFRGTFDDKDRGRILSGFDILLVPSIGLESYGLVAREAMAVGVPVLVSDHGALAEMMEGGAPGSAVEAGDEAAWRRWVERLVDDPSLLAAWRRNLPAVKGMDEHAEEIESVYTEVLDGGRS